MYIIYFYRYEGTGKSLSFKLFKELRDKTINPVFCKPGQFLVTCPALLHMQSCPPTDFINFSKTSQVVVFF